MPALNIDAVVAVVGAGTMGAGIAQVAAAAGHSVLLFDAQSGAAAAGLERTAQGLDRLVSKGKISQQQRDDWVGRIAIVETLEALAPAQLVIEAIVEDLGVKQQVLSRLQSICHQDTIIASNTSSISITAIGAGLEHPQRLAGMHFFNPAPIMKLVEVIRGIMTDDKVLKTLVETADAWGKVPVLARSTPGFIVNRVARPFYAEALRVLGEGGSDVVTIDSLLREAGGFRMGPFQLMDLIGNDVNYAVTCSVFDAYYQDPRFKPSLIQREMVDGGLLGRKSGYGYYQYGDNAPQAQAEQMPSCAAPKQARQLGQAKVTAALNHRANEVIDSAQPEESTDIGFVLDDEVFLLLTDGRSATERAQVSGNANTIVFDLALDYGQCQHLAIAAADQAGQHAVKLAAGFLQALGITLSRIDDIPGLVVLRTVAMLANEAADAVHQGVASIEDVDAAMCYGVNYPRGPLAWADAIGIRRLVDTLDNLAANYGEDRYRVSPLLRRHAFSQRPMHD